MPKYAQDIYFNKDDILPDYCSFGFTYMVRYRYRKENLMEEHMYLYRIVLD